MFILLVFRFPEKDVFLKYDHFHRDMVKCELRVANASCELLIFCELRVTSCTYCASYELRVALIMRVASCELNERCELETHKCELKPKVRVACFLL